MILIGQYDSSYVRRVGIALRLYGLAFENYLASIPTSPDGLAAGKPWRSGDAIGGYIISIRGTSA